MPTIDNGMRHDRIYESKEVVRPECISVGEVRVLSEDISPKGPQSLGRIRRELLQELNWTGYFLVELR